MFWRLWLSGIVLTTASAVNGSPPVQLTGIFIAAGPDDGSKDDQGLSAKKGADAVRPGGVALYGKVSDEKGAPLAGAKVILYGGLATRWKIAEATTDNDGRFRFESVVSSRVKNEATKAWDHYVGVRFEHPTHVPADGKSWRDISLPGAGNETAKLDMRMTEGGWIEGVIVDAKTGKPLKVDLRASSPAERRDKGTFFMDYLESVENGRFRSACLAAGEYVVDVNSGVLGYPRLSTVKVNAGQTTRISIRAGLPERIVGTVVDRDGNPVAGAEVTLVEPGVIPQWQRKRIVSGRSASWFITRDDGKFELARLPGLEKSESVFAGHRTNGTAIISVRELSDGKPLRLTQSAAP
jgi:hypothetical protein